MDMTNAPRAHNPALPMSEKSESVIAPTEQQAPAGALGLGTGSAVQPLNPPVNELCFWHGFAHDLPKMPRHVIIHDDLTFSFLPEDELRLRAAGVLPNDPGQPHGK